MRNQHLTEEEIQDCALDRTAISPEIAAHLSTCKSCEEKVRGYGLLFSGLEKMPSPAFDFNVTDLVLPQLAKPSPRYSWMDILIWLLVSAGVVIAGIFLVELKHLFTGYGGYLITFTALMVLLIQIIGYYRKYQKQMDLLGI